MIKLITIECQDCKGTGLVHATEMFRGKRVSCAVLCVECNGNGTISFDFVCCDQCGEPCCDCEDAPAPTPEPATAPVVYNGGIVDAPGFTTATFAAGVAKAQAAGTIHMVRLPDGSIRVDTGRTGHVYIVTRERCTCPAGRSHGHCYHRAAVLFTHDVCGINFRHDGLVLGFNEVGDPVLRSDRLRELAAA